MAISFEMGKFFRYPRIGVKIQRPVTRPESIQTAKDRETYPAKEKQIDSEIQSGTDDGRTDAA